MGRGLTVALAISIAANIFLVGLFAGKAAFGPSPQAQQYGEAGPPDGFRRGGPGEMRGPGFGMLSASSPEVRAAFREALFDRRDVFRGRREEAKAAREALVAAFASDPFDEAAVRAAFAEVHRLEDVRRELSIEIMVEVLKDIPAEERARMIAEGRERFEERRGRRRKRRGEGERG